MQCHRYLFLESLGVFEAVSPGPPLFFSKGTDLKSVPSQYPQHLLLQRFALRPVEIPGDLPDDHIPRRLTQAFAQVGEKGRGRHQDQLIEVPDAENVVVYSK